MLGRATWLAPAPRRSPTRRGTRWSARLPSSTCSRTRLRDGDAALEWLYFGPNSAAVFGTPGRRRRPSCARRAARPSRGPGRRPRARESGARGPPREVEIRIPGGDGAERWISWRSVPRRVEGVLHVDGVATDVSSRHSLGGAAVTSRRPTRSTPARSTCAVGTPSRSATPTTTSCSASSPPVSGSRSCDASSTTSRLTPRAPSPSSSTRRPPTCASSSSTSTRSSATCRTRVAPLSHRRRSEVPTPSSPGTRRGAARRRPGRGGAPPRRRSQGLGGGGAGGRVLDRHAATRARHRAPRPRAGRARGAACRA